MNFEQSVCPWWVQHLKVIYFSLFCAISFDFRVCKYCDCHRFQNICASTCTRFHCLVYRFLLSNIPGIPVTCCGFCVNNKGVSGVGSSGSDVRGTSGLELTCWRFSKKSYEHFMSKFIFIPSIRSESSTLLVIPITRSQTSSICEAWRELNCHV